ncbi:MAG: pyridoxal-phosphate dependent enzyme [Nitriliruptorales bacterium]|nr:pyridoxal-phosphate dependent enzyme [Nitriliruptorales bacterium]
MIEPGMPSPSDVAAAAERIRPYVRRTPLLTADLGGWQVTLKLEHLQLTGSFKIRSATNTLRSLDPPPGAVVAASGGNHGLGVAAAAAALGAAATIVVPESVPAEKARRITETGATVVRHGGEYAEAEAHARRLAETLAAPFVHPFDDPAVVAGQGTVGLEFAQDLGSARLAERCDALLVAVGGGGLIAGIATALEGTGVRVVGVEPVGVPTMSAALKAGEPVDVDVDSVAASALGARRTSPLNLAVAQRAVDRVVLVEDEEILAARDLLWEACRLAVEPAGALGLAALLTGTIEAERPGLVLCGANSAWRPA